DFAKALVEARRIMSAGDRATNREKLLASLIVANLPDAGARREATAQLTALANGESTVALDALVLLAQRRLGGEVDAEGFSYADLIQRLNQHHLAKPVHRLLALELQMRANPASHDEIIQHAIAEYGNASDREAFARLMAWLNEQREPTKVLELLS